MSPPLSRHMVHNGGFLFGCFCQESTPQNTDIICMEHWMCATCKHCDEKSATNMSIILSLLPILLPHFKRA